jgi:hypothetical protein
MTHILQELHDENAYENLLPHEHLLPPTRTYYTHLLELCGLFEEISESKDTLRNGFEVYWFEAGEGVLREDDG